MTPTPHFRTVMRGYEPAEVDARLRALTDELSTASGAAGELATAQQRVADLSARVAALEAEREQQRQQASAAVPQATYESLGERIGSILALADQEAQGLREQATVDAESHRQGVDQRAATVQSDADRYAQETRGAADADATRSREDAKRASDEMLDDADRDATARREEAEAVYENQRARAAQAAADFETTLAQRRFKAEKDFMERGAAGETELELAQDRIELLRQEAERAHRDAMAAASRELEQAREKAAEIVSAAQARATRVRAESDREVGAASQRRDSINAQLTNVRQMLATLSGTAPAPAAPADSAADSETETEVDTATGNPSAAEPQADDEPEVAPSSDDEAADEADDQGVDEGVEQPDDTVCAAQSQADVQPSVGGTGQRAAH